MRAGLFDLISAEKLGGSKGLSVEIRKATEGLRDAVKRAPKRRIRVEVVEGVGRKEEKNTLETNERGEFELELLDSQQVRFDREPMEEKADTKRVGLKVKTKVPRNATEFELVWRSLKSNDGEKLRYLNKVVKSKKSMLHKIYPAGFQDASMFEGILSIIFSSTEPCREIVEDFSKVKNIDMMCMMVEKCKVKKVVEKAFGTDVPDFVKKTLAK